ncbi:MAG: LCP family protein [Patescibacteria group bacterium]
MEGKPIKYWGLVALVIILAGANLWLFNKNFLAKTKGNLPSLKANFFSASSFVVKNKIYEPKPFRESKNILVLGQSGGNYIAPDLTDTILIIHLDGPTQKAKIISLPRDLAVKTESGTTKINGLYKIGNQESETEGLVLIKNEAEEITGLTINSFILFDLDVVEKVIDDIGGLNVLVKEDINDTRFPMASGGYETFKLEKGLRYLDGQTALKFVRTRASARGDFDRIDHQQAVLKAIKGKILSLNPVWDFPKLWGIFKTVQKNLKTDLTLSDFRDLWSFSKNLDLEKVETFSLNIETGLVKSEKMKFGAQTAYVLVATPKAFDYANIQKAIISFIGQ